MNTHIWLNLQLFSGEGAQAGGEGAEAGESADPGRQRLPELGVPADKLPRRANGAGAKPRTDGQAAAAEQDTQEPSRRMSWAEIMADPEYNRQMQAVVQQRLRGARRAQGAVATPPPALEATARRHRTDTQARDNGALAQVLGDEGQPRQAQPDYRQHFEGLTRQAEELKRTFPGFDLQRELKNPAFARMTSPAVGVSLEDAYFAVHRAELQAAAMQVTAQKTAQKISNAIVSGSHRPSENGTSGQGPSVATFDYRAMSQAQRKALKDRIRAGEKIYPAAR